MNFLRSVLSLLSFVAAGLLITGCGDIEQNLKINADGSGRLETSFDIGEMMSMIKGFGEMNMMTGDEDTLSNDEAEGIIIEEPSAPKDPMEILIEQVTSVEYSRDFDTLMSFLSIMPDSVREKETRPDLANKLSLRLKSPAKSANLVMGLVMNFDSPAHLKELVEYMEKMDDSANAGVLANASPGGLKSENFLVFEADMKAGWIRFDSMDYSGVASEMGMSADGSMSSEDMGMVEMMFGGTKLKSIIQVPGEVISCTYPEAILTKDNRVIIEYSFIDLIRKGKMDGYIIHFKPK